MGVVPKWIIKKWTTSEDWNGTAEDGVQGQAAVNLLVPYKTVNFFANQLGTVILSRRPLCSTEVNLLFVL
jgi:hypothetical protein